jgi:hypothetical protein
VLKPKGSEHNLAMTRVSRNMSLQKPLQPIVCCVDGNKYIQYISSVVCSATPEDELVMLET